MTGKLAIAVVLALAGTASAHADPFLRAKGEGRIIASGVFTDSARGFDDDGNVSDNADYDQDQVYVLAEYGVSDDLTVILSPSYRSVSIENDDDIDGLGYTEVGARYRLAHGQDWLVSTQALLRIPGAGRQESFAQIGSTSTDIDLRLGAAYAAKAWFGSAEGGYRLRSGDLPNEFHADFSAGTNLTNRFMLLATLANTFSDGPGENIVNQSYRYGDAYVSGVFAVTDRISVQAGYTATIYGKNALRQRGPLVGVWIHF
ncbi:hypothetical protein RM533_07880 [Croceicoccus sp. F390]|uniref:Transporter n=1 Tax=Croceicoccus esteveae TaxID=3075597 RepID=A0ABU2ZI83_9SPHN|nr:hypothetical protein [Croceicoccus sp. F390]MDT0576105.1 hypothetical protein [Croceicoccus sp. F390]